MASSPKRHSVGQGSTISEIKCADTYFRGLGNTLQNLAHDAIDEIAHVLVQAYKDRAAVFLFGNGGSAALASHLACDLGKGTAMQGQERFRVLSLTDNVPLMTAWANDACYEEVFAEQIRNFVQPGDIAFAISGSGNSPNVLKGLEIAKALGTYNIGLSGYEGGKMKSLCDICVVIPSHNMQVIEDLHLSVSHCIFSIVYNGIAQLAQQSITT